MDKPVSSKDAMKFGLKGFKDVIEHNWHGKTICVNYQLTRVDYYNLVNTIEQMCTLENGDFSDIYLSLAIRIGVIGAFSNIELPSDPNDLFKFIYGSDIFKTIIKLVNPDQIQDLFSYFHYVYKDLGASIWEF